MPERLRAFLDRPLGPSAARAVLALGSAVFVGFAAVALLGLAHRGEGSSAPTSQATTHLGSSIAPHRGPLPRGGWRAPRAGSPPQDSQDRPGTFAARRAQEMLASHRALQHVPFRGAGATIMLAGARGGRAVLRVRAATLSAARRGWHRFLARFEDSGRAYVPVFVRRAHRG